MAQNQPGGSRIRYETDYVGTVLEWLGSKCLLVGSIAALAGAAFLIYYSFHFNNFAFSTVGGDVSKVMADASGTIGIFKIVFVVGLLVFGIGMTVNFWGDIALGVTLFLTALLFYFAPQWVPFLLQITPGGTAKALVEQSLGSLSMGGLLLGFYAIALQAIDLWVRIRTRTLFGAKGDLMKYGVGVHEVEEIRNVFMGKCWQLPYCRKFVREKCPIFHARRTCWRERVGCMCEEEVIRGAMEGNIIPKDTVAAARMIPYNRAWTPQQKAERCRQCVIYNEHQRHKYRLAVPTTFIAVGLIYFGFRSDLLTKTQMMLGNVETSMQKVSYTSQGEAYTQLIEKGSPPGFLEEFVLILLTLFVLAQLMKVVEFAIFKLKV